MKFQLFRIGFNYCALAGYAFPLQCSQTFHPLKPQRKYLNVYIYILKIVGFFYIQYEQNSLDY